MTSCNWDTATVGDAVGVSRSVSDERRCILNGTLVSSSAASGMLHNAASFDTRYPKSGRFVGTTFQHWRIRRAYSGFTPSGIVGRSVSCTIDALIASSLSCEVARLQKRGLL